MPGPRQLILLFPLFLLLSPAYAASTSVTPRAVNPFGIQFNNTVGSITPTLPELFASIAVCADKPNPATVLGLPCNNGSGNDTIYFIYRGFELAQKLYTFNVQAYANATGSHLLVLRFPGNVPSKVLGSTMSSFGFDYANGWEQVVFTAGTTDPVFTIIFNTGSQGLFNAVVVGSAFVPLIIISLGILFGTTMFARFKATITETEPFVTVKQAFIVGVVVILGWLIVLIIAAQTGGALQGAGA